MSAMIVTETKHMEMTACIVDVGGRYDPTTGQCTYPVKINENGEREYINSKRNRKRGR